MLWWSTATSYLSASSCLFNLASRHNRRSAGKATWMIGVAELMVDVCGWMVCIVVLTRTRIHYYNTRRLPSPTQIPCIRIRQTHEMRVRKSRARTAFHMSLSPISPFAHTSMKLHSSTHLSTHPSSNYTHHPPTHIDHQFSHTDHPGSFSGASSIVSRC